MCNACKVNSGSSKLRLAGQPITKLGSSSGGPALNFVLVLLYTKKVEPHTSFWTGICKLDKEELTFVIGPQAPRNHTSSLPSRFFSPITCPSLFVVDKTSIHLFHISSLQ